MLFLHLCVKSELEEQRSHKFVTVMSIEFDLLLLVSLQCYIFQLVRSDNLSNLLLVKTLIESNQRTKDSLIWINSCCLEVKSFHDSPVKLS